MRYARIYPWRRTRRSRAPSNGSEAFFVTQFSAGYTINMFGFDLRQGQVKCLAQLLVRVLAAGRRRVRVFWVLAAGSSPPSSETTVTPAPNNKHATLFFCRAGVHDSI